MYTVSLTPAELRRLRAREELRRAYSGRAMLLRLLQVPMVGLSVALALYLQTSPYPRDEALLHLTARLGCDYAARVGLAPAYRGEIGYHDRNDPDRNGIACEPPLRTEAGGARFVRP